MSRPPVQASLSQALPLKYHFNVFWLMSRATDARPIAALKACRLVLHIS